MFRFLRRSHVAKWQTPTSGPQFVVGTKNGFLPRQDPLDHSPFQQINDLLDEMPITKTNGQPGLLAKAELHHHVDQLPLFDIAPISDNQQLTALFRDYTFLTSAYLLEQCDLNMRTKGHYGQGRSLLPKQLAIPLHHISQKLNQFPFMEYAQSYALYNYKKIDPSGNLDYANLKLIRAFTNEPSEAGFILTHVAMVQYTPDLVNSICHLFDAMGDRPTFNKHFQSLLACMDKINQEMETMWAASKPQDYNKFRTFIMGITNQKEIFPNGVVYEGVSPTPQYYRGESGANDSIIPTCDNLLQITNEMPNNPLTAILKDFRKYRPIKHTQWLSYVQETAEQVQFYEYCMADEQSRLAYLHLLDHVRDFRHRHWSFTKEYILKYSNHPVATGGSPIVTWLPNQLQVVLEKMQQVGGPLQVSAMMDKVESQLKVLKRDVEEYALKIKN